MRILLAVIYVIIFIHAPIAYQLQYIEGYADGVSASFVRTTYPQAEETVEEDIPTARGWFRITGYNTVPEQTDATPCIGASGDNICGRVDVVACPRWMPLGTLVSIDNDIYECLDRTSLRVDGIFDISCDKDMECPSRVTGYKEVIWFL